MPTRFSEFLLDQMTLKGLNANQLSKRLSVHRSTVSRWLNNEDTPRTLALIQSMATLLEIPLEVISNAISGTYEPLMTREEREAREIKQKYSPKSIDIAAGVNYLGPPEGFYRFPCKGSVRAGALEPAQKAEDVTYYEWVDVKHYDAEMFCLKVVGDSMAPRIPDGAVILVRPAQTFKDKGIYVIQTDRDESTMKVLELSAKEGKLVPLNPQYAPIRIEHFSIEKAFEVLEYKVSLI